MTAPVINSAAVITALLESGIVRPEDRVTRVVIDIKLGEVPVIHIQRFGDTRLLKVIPSLDGVEIRRDEVPG